MSQQEGSGSSVNTMTGRDAQGALGPSIQQHLDILYFNLFIHHLIRFNVSVNLLACDLCDQLGLRCEARSTSGKAFSPIE